MSEAKAGLITETGNTVPLQGVEVRGEVLGGHAQVRVRQRYRNVESRPVEAIYTFPLPSDATLTGFSMTCDGRRVEGVVKAREEAFRDYDEAVYSGHGAALLDRERANVFTAQVGNLLPGEETIVEVEYVQRIQADEGALRWSIPTLVAPRYIPGTAAGDRTGHGWADPTDQVPDADRITPPHGDVAYGLSLDLLFDLGRPVEVESPSHAVRTEREGRRVRVSFAQREVALDRDVVITARAAGNEPLTPVVAHRREGEPGVVALTVVPDLFEAKRDGVPQEVVFLVDTSGSMNGASIEEARSALRLCLRHLREGDRFNIIAFQSRFQSFSPGPVPFTQRTLEQADRWMAALVASGGTELLAPLLAGLQMAPDGVVVLLTDGQVGNEDEILRRALETRGRARIYSFGIGTNVSDVLLRNLAQRTGGAVEMIHPGERIDEKVVAQFSRATAARITDVTLSFDGVDIGELAPAALPPLVDGEPWVLLGRYERPGSGAVELRGTLRGGPFRLRIPVELPARSERPHVPKLWAAERIRDLEVTELTGRRARAMEDRIVRLAVEHQIASRYTSFVVIEKRTGDRRATGQPETRVIPVNLPAGWAMFDRADSTRDVRSRSVRLSGVSAASVAPAEAMAAPQARSAARASPAAAVGAVFESLGKAIFSARGEGGGRTGRAKGEIVPYDAELERVQEASAAAGSPVVEERSAEPVVGLLGRQLANGLWDEPGSGEDRARQVRATARALLELLRVGVTTSHPLHGAQVLKAVEALLRGAMGVAAAQPRLAELALGVAWLISTGQRTRERIERTVSAQRSLSGLGAPLGDEGRTRQRVDELAAAL